MSTPPPLKDRASRDQALFDRIASDYARKDLLPAARIARQHRSLATWSRGEDAVANCLLDVGCGAGFAARHLEGRYHRYVGIDYSRELIQSANQLNTGPTRQFVVADAVTYQPPEPPDAILMIGVLHHMEDPVATLEHLFTILRPGGYLLANEPQSSNPVLQVARRLRGIVDPGYSDEQDQYRPTQLARMAESAGFEEVRVYGQGLLTTPLAEVPVPGQRLLAPVARLAGLFDRTFESAFPGMALQMSWNVVLACRKPAHRL